MRWRKSRAAALGVPAFAVVTDDVLRSLARERPQTRVALARVEGIGPRTLAKWSEELLAILSFPSRSDTPAPTP